jgi:hypothetical protein
MTAGAGPLATVLRVEVAKLELQPGDVLLCQLPERASADEMQRIGAALRQLAPDGVRCAVVDGGAEFTVVRPADVTGGGRPARLPRGFRSGATSCWRRRAAVIDATGLCSRFAVVRTDDTAA